MRDLSGYLTLILFVLVIPLGLCFAVERCREWFAGARLPLWPIGVTLFSWLWVNGLILIPYYLGLTQIRGPEAAFALLFGWLYLWIAMLPVITIYLICRLIRNIWRQ